MQTLEIYTSIYSEIELLLFCFIMTHMLLLTALTSLPFWPFSARLLSFIQGTLLQCHFHLFPEKRQINGFHMFSVIM